MAINTIQTKEARLKLGITLRKLREKKLMSKYRVAKLSGLTQEQVNTIELGKSCYTIDSLNAYIAAIDCNIHISS